MNKLNEEEIIKKKKLEDFQNRLFKTKNEFENL